MKKKNSSVLQRWVCSTKCPTEEVCHHAGRDGADIHGTGSKDDHECGERQNAKT